MTTHSEINHLLVVLNHVLTSLEDQIHINKALFDMIQCLIKELSLHRKEV